MDISGVKSFVTKAGQAAEKVGHDISDAQKPNASSAPQVSTASTDTPSKTPAIKTDIPKRHKGGPVMKSGPYLLQAGEHVLTAEEAKKARKHALMASGMKSLSKEGPTVKAAKAVKENKKTGGLTTTINPDDMA